MDSFNVIILLISFIFSSYLNGIIATEKIKCNLDLCKYKVIVDKDTLESFTICKDTLAEIQKGNQKHCISSMDFIKKNFKEISLNFDKGLCFFVSTHNVRFENERMEHRNKDSKIIYKYLC
jgi:predicted transcriptional regulator